jgi:hypothetical protein
VDLLQQKFVIFMQILILRKQKFGSYLVIVEYKCIDTKYEEARTVEYGIFVKVL